MPSASEDNELTEDVPINFKDEYEISVNVGMPVFLGTNLDNRYDSGMGFSINIATPFGFNLMNKDISIAGSINSTSMASKEDGLSAYAPMNIGANLVTDLMMLDVSFGTGLSMASGSWSVGEDDYSFTTLYTAMGLSYTLPLASLLESAGSLSNLKVSVGGKFTMIFASPDDWGDTSDIIDLGLSVSYPVLF